jgi:DNA-binding LytR/AlgR family response regulator
MQALSCLIIEDEPLAAQVVSDYVAQVPGLELKGICDNAFSAMEKLRLESIDLIFLDINLPKWNGIDFLKTLRGNCHIILTTAYHQYALKGYELDVVDYLLKPIDFSRFIQAVNKVFGRRGLRVDGPASGEEKYHFFNVDKTRIKVAEQDILYIESLKDYVRIHTTEKNLVTKFRIGEMEKLLRDGRFLRIHKSFIINLSRLTSYSASQVDIEGKKIAIGRIYKRIAGDKLGQL